MPVHLMQRSVWQIEHNIHSYSLLKSGEHLCRKVRRCECGTVSGCTSHTGRIWDTRGAGTIADASIGVWLLDIFYIAIACGLIRINCPLFPGLLELLQEPDFGTDPSRPTTTKAATDQAAPRRSPQPRSAGEARLVFDV